MRKLVDITIYITGASILFVLFLFIGLSNTANATPPSDNASYVNGTNFTKTRQVADQTTGVEFVVGTTSKYLTLPRNSLFITFINDDTTGNLYVNPSGNVAINQTVTNATTWAGSNELDLNIVKELYDIKVGDLIYLNSGDANDGVYAIIGINSNNNVVKLDKTLTVAHTANQSYVLQSIPLKPGESIDIDSGSKNVSYIGSETTTNARVIVAYQKGS